MDSLSQPPIASSTPLKQSFPQISKSVPQQTLLLSWAGQVIGNDALHVDDLTDGYVFLQIIYAYIPSSFDISAYSTPDHSTDLTTRNFGILETVFQEQLSQSAPLKTITAAKSGDSKALIEMLRVLKTALEAKMESVAPAAEEEVIVKREKVTKKADYEVSDYSFKLLVRWILRFACRSVSDEKRKSELSRMVATLNNPIGNIPGDIIALLCSSDLYTQITSQIFKDEAATSSTAFMDVLIKNHFLNYKKASLESAKGMIKESNPFYESIHAYIILALMNASTRNVTVEDIVEHMCRYLSFNPNVLYPFDTEDALLIWCNQCINRYNSPSSSSQIEEIDDLLVDVENGKPLFAVISAYHSEAANWEIEDYHSATILACKSWSPLAVPWIADEVDECFESNKTHLKSLFKSFMIELLDAINSQDIKKATPIVTKKEPIDERPIETKKIAEPVVSLHQQQVNHFNRGFSKLPSIGSKTILKQDETLLDDEEVEAEAESDEEEAQDESQELSNGDAEFSHFPPVENEQMKLTEAAQEWDENQQSEEEEEEGDEDCGGAKDDILDIDMGEQDDEEQEEESDKGYSESENQDEISTNEELQQFENNSERNKEGSVRSQVFQLEDEDDEEYQPKDEAEAEQEQEESEVEEHKEMHEPPSDKITMRSDLAQLLLDDAADSTSEEDSHDPPHFEVDNDYYDSEEECAYGELSNANQGNQESEAFKKDGDEEKEEEVEQKHELLQSSSETVIQGQMDEFVDQQNNDENEWEEMDDEGSEMQNTSTSIPLPQSSSQIIQAQGESEWETEQEVVKTRQIPRKKKKRASARSSSSRKSIAKESQPQSPKLETAAPADNVISVSVSSTLKQAPKRASITRAMEPIQAPAAPVEPPKEEPVKVSIPSLSKSSSKKQGLVFIPLNEESPSTKHPNRSFSRMPSRSGSASTRRASTNDLAQAAEPVSVVQRTSSSAKSHVAEITNNPENVQEETVAPATQGSPDKKGVPRQKQLTNRTLIRNALIHVCLAGSVNSQVKQDVLEALDASPHSHFLILFRQVNNFSFRGLYAMDPECSKAIKVYKQSQGPDIVEASGVAEYYKYDSGGRTFKVVPTRSFGKSVHALALSGAVKYKKRPTVTAKSK